MLLILGCLVSSCTSTRFVGQKTTVSRNDTLTYGETHRRLQSSVACVYLTDNQEMLRNVVQITSDTVYVSETRTSPVVAIPIGAVQRIERIDRVGGFVGGFFGGIAVGLLAGGGVGSLMGAAKGENIGFAAAVFAVLGAGVGALAGPVYGVIHGIVHVYQFQDESVLHSSSEQDTSGTP